MIIPDINLLLYAYDDYSFKHDQSRQWFNSIINSGALVAMPWAVVNGFIRLSTGKYGLKVPITIEHSFKIVESWLELPQVQIISPGPEHFKILKNLLTSEGVGSKLVTDAHLAALAIERRCELHSNDTDFTRFSGLKWVNPLK